MTARNRFLDGVVCTCGQIKDESDILFCSICGDVCCDDCMLVCASCGNEACRNCKSVFERSVCQECESPYIGSDYAESMKKHDPDEVFIIISGNTYHINKDNGMAKVLVNDTQPFQMRERVECIDIKGLGVLYYSHRSIRFNSSSKGMEYYLYFNQAFDEIAY